jgi:hypothetical protein
MDLEATAIRRGVDRGKIQTFVIKIFRSDKTEGRTSM